MVNAARTFMRNGRKAMIGLCSACGTKVTVAGKWDDDVEQHPSLGVDSAGGRALPAIGHNGSGYTRPISGQSRLTAKVETG